MSHPLRADLLATLSERVASPRELAEEVGLEVSDVSYHVRALKKSKCIELVKTRRRRGAVEHFYRATSRFLLDDYEWDRLPKAIKPGISADLLRLILDDVSRALEAKTFDARNRHLSWTPLRVDERGWSDLVALMEKALAGVLEIQAESSERLAREKAEGFGATVAVLGFETAPQATIETGAVEG